jgi:hypothetical protein
MLSITEALCTMYLCEEDTECLMDFAVVSTGDELCSHISKYCPKGLCKTRERSKKGFLLSSTKTGSAEYKIHVMVSSHHVKFNNIK